MSLQYVGSLPSEAASVATLNYVNSLVARNLSENDVKQAISNYFTPNIYASYSWANSIINASGQSAFARQTDLSSGVLTKIPVLTPGSRSRANGPVELDFTGKIHPSIIPAQAPGSQQSYPQMFWGASNYTNLTNVSTEQTISTVTVNPYPTNPQKSYRVLVTGAVNARTSVDGQFPQILVRAKSALSGQVVATGYGLGENYKGGEVRSYFTPGDFIYPIPGWCDKIDIVAVGGGGGGINVPFGPGGGGGAGTWETRTITRTGPSPDISPSTVTFTGRVGEGAINEDFDIRGLNEGGAGRYGTGGTTKCTIPGAGDLNAAGGKTGAGQSAVPASVVGQSPGNKSYAEITYVGGPPQLTAGAAGNSPGGGGAGGQPKAGGVGAAGAIFFCAYTNDYNNYGQISIVPSLTNSQEALTGSTTLYVNISRAFGSSSTAITTSALNPQVSVMVVPI